MGNQNLIFLAIGLFVSLIVATAAVDQYLLDEHPETEVDGLIWRVQNAYAQIKDMEAALELTDESRSKAIRLVVHYVAGADSALSVTFTHEDEDSYKYQDALREQVFTVERDLLSHYIPQENLVIVKRWVGLPLTEIALASFDLSGLQEGWRSGRLSMRILQDVPGFDTDLFPSPLSLSETIAGLRCPNRLSLCTDTSEQVDPALRFSSTAELPSITAGSIRGGFILEVREASTGELSRMIWIARDTYMIEKILFFVGGQRSASIRVERMTRDQGTTPEEVLTLPLDADVVRG